MAQVRFSGRSGGNRQGLVATLSCLSMSKPMGQTGARKVSRGVGFVLWKRCQMLVSTRCSLGSQGESSRAPVRLTARAEPKAESPRGHRPGPCPGGGGGRVRGAPLFAGERVLALDLRLLVDGPSSLALGRAATVLRLTGSARAHACAAHGCLERPFTTKHMDLKDNAASRLRSSYLEEAFGRG